MKNILIALGVSVLFIAAVAPLNGIIYLDNLDVYTISAPNYVVRDNTGSNAISNEGATLGRVFFYD